MNLMSSKPLRQSNERFQQKDNQIQKENKMLLIQAYQILSQNIISAQMIQVKKHQKALKLCMIYEKNCQDILHILLAILFTYRLITKGTIDYKEFSEHLNEFVNQNKKFLSDQDINIFGELLDYWIGLCKKTFTQE
ncbi:hypothetical protein ABPG72_017318 [Tetrahymena utriculariae]